jgi:hypothetical protein
MLSSSRCGNLQRPENFVVNVNRGFALHSFFWF